MNTQIQGTRTGKRKHSKNNEIEQGSSQEVVNYNKCTKISNDDTIIISDSDDENDSNKVNDSSLKTNAIVRKLQFIVTNNNTRQKQLFPEYCEELFDRMQLLLYNRNLDDQLHCRKTPWNMKVKDILTVFSPSTWLNDVVINDFLSFIKTKSNTVWIFDSFFLQMYIKYGYDRVFKTTKNVDIFTKKKLLIPVNTDNMHWSLICVDIERKSIHLYDSLYNFNSRNFSPFAYVSMYLFEEHFAKTHRILNFEDWKYFIGKSPIQQNSFDCGVFVCMNSSELSRHTQPTFTQKDMSLFRHLITYILMKDSLVD